jgi:exonuclease SbcC
MIITRIQAKDLLKYEQLDLTIPEQGIIAISGQNESGKSSIGEAVCFALFGRTFSIEENALHKLVRWGQDYCSVTLECRLGGHIYEISRFLDNGGNHSAKLLRVAEEKVIARGVDEVAAALADLMGYGYDQFIESFYLAQREIIAPHPHSQAVKIMSGVEPLEKAVHAIQDEIAERQELVADIQGECAAMEDGIMRLSASSAQLSNIQEEEQETTKHYGQIQALVEEMQQGVDAYTQNEKQIQQVTKSRSFMRFWRFVFFFVLAIAGGAAWLLMQTEVNIVHELLDKQLPDWRNVPKDWFTYAAIAAGMLFLMSWMRITSLNARIRGLRADSGKVMDSLLRARSIDVEIDAPPEDIDELDEDDLLGIRNTDPVRPSAETLELIQPAVAAGTASSQQLRNYAEPEITWFNYVAELLYEETEHLKGAVQDEGQRLGQQQNLQKNIAGLEGRASQIDKRIGIRETALELLGGAIAHLSNQFNRDIKGMVVRTLPLFTNGRYEHLQVDSDLRVRVFSSDKRDFMDLEEVSSGTQRQIMLALRLALSQTLLSRTVKDKQFAFLDEPFAFFDEERTRSALMALSNLDEQINQVWIVAQSFPQQADVKFAAHLECGHGKTHLVI